MQCKNHPEKEAIAICQKFNVGYCEICCETVKIEDEEPLCYCTSPNVHCKFRSQCIVYHKARKRSREIKAKSQD